MNRRIDEQPITGPAAGGSPHPCKGEIDIMNMKAEDYWMVGLVLFSISFTLSFGWGFFG